MKTLSIKIRQQGLTLIELMIALLLGAVLLAGILQIFGSTKQTYRMQDNMSRMQENGRFAMDFISKDIRMAGFWGCANPATIEKKLNDGNAAFDVFTRTDLTFKLNPTALAGQDNDNTNASIVDGTDSITLNGALAPGVSLTIPAVGLTNPLSVTNNSGLVVDSFVLISDCTSGDIFQITDVTTGSSSDTITHGSGNSGKLGNVSMNLGSGYVALNPGAPLGPEVPDQNPFGTAAQIYKTNFVRYQIRSGTGGQPGLFRSTNGDDFLEIVEGIDDMQILYGADTNADNSPDYYVAAETGGLVMANVVSIRIQLLVASRDANLTQTNVTYTYNGNNVTPTDRRLRRVFSSTIAVRNRLP